MPSTWSAVECRLRVLEQIVTDSGVQTASQIEALRDQARIPVGEKSTMNPFEFVLAVLILVFAFTIIRHKMGIPVRSMREMRGEPGDDQENDRLRQQVKQLQEPHQRARADRHRPRVSRRQRRSKRCAIATASKTETRSNESRGTHGGPHRRDRHDRVDRPSEARLGRYRSRRDGFIPQQDSGENAPAARRGRRAQGANQGARADHGREGEQPGQGNRVAPRPLARLGRAGMAGLPALSDMLEEYQLVEAEDRYRLLIDLGRQLEPMPDALKTDATKVRGCSASVWVYPTRERRPAALPRRQQCGDHQGHRRAGADARSRTSPRRRSPRLDVAERARAVRAYPNISAPTARKACPT